MRGTTAIVGGRAPDASAVRCDVATQRAVAPSGKLTMIARPVIRVAENKGEGKSV
jgi:16S rRNA G527 N7-methylase RsmG